MSILRLAQPLIQKNHTSIFVRILYQPCVMPNFTPSQPLSLNLFQLVDPHTFTSLGFPFTPLSVKICYRRRPQKKQPTFSHNTSTRCSSPWRWKTTGTRAIRQAWQRKWNNEPLSIDTSYVETFYQTIGLLWRPRPRDHTILPRLRRGHCQLTRCWKTNRNCTLAVKYVTRPQLSLTLAHSCISPLRWSKF